MWKSGAAQELARLLMPVKNGKIHSEDSAANFGLECPQDPKETLKAQLKDLQILLPVWCHNWPRFDRTKFHKILSGGKNFWANFGSMFGNGGAGGTTAAGATGGAKSNSQTSGSWSNSGGASSAGNPASWAPPSNGGAATGGQQFPVPSEPSPSSQGGSPYMMPSQGSRILKMWPKNIRCLTPTLVLLMTCSQIDKV